LPNVGAGLKPVIFGDLKRGYTLVEHTDVNVQRDPYSLARWGQVQFNWRRRVGGAVRLAEALAVLNVQA
jgi:HK97 family phage major capsid protein